MSMTGCDPSMKRVAAARASECIHLLTKHPHVPFPDEPRITREVGSEKGNPKIGRKIRRP